MKHNSFISKQIQEKYHGIQIICHIAHPWNRMMDFSNLHRIYLYACVSKGRQWVWEKIRSDSLPYIISDCRNFVGGGLMDFQRSRVHCWYIYIRLSSCLQLLGTWDLTSVWLRIMVYRFGEKSMSFFFGSPMDIVCRNFTGAMVTEYSCTRFAASCFTFIIRLRYVNAHVKARKLFFMRMIICNFDCYYEFNIVNAVQ